MNRTQAWTLLAGKAVFGATMAIGLTMAPGTASAHSPIAPMEDEPGWSCVDDGNRVCGPDNAEGKPAGCYDDGGVMEFAWPCTPWQPSYGYVHGDGTVTYPNGDVWCPTDGEIYGSVQDCAAHDMRPAAVTR